MLHPHPPSGQEPSVHEPPGRPWELELLISGAVVFALVQLPSWLDGFFERITPHLAQGPRIAAVAAQFGLTMVVYALIVAFVVHLAARAYWVGLVGLDAVFPHGVRWSESRYGPISRKYVEARYPSLQTLTDRADRFCSVIFSFAFTVGYMALAGAVMGAALLMASYLISEFFLHGRHSGRVAVVLYVVLLGPLMVLPLIDRKFGDGIAEDGLLASAIRAALRVQNVVFLASLYMPIMNVLNTNVNRKVFYSIVFVGLLGLEGAVFLREAARSGEMDIGEYDYLAAAGAPEFVEYRHYADQRRASRSATSGAEPMIQSDVIRGPFVKLFIPFLPRRHGEVLEEECPQVVRREERPTSMAPAEYEAREGVRTQAVIGCLGRIQPVALNGVPQDSLRFRFYTDPETEIRGLLAYIPTAQLPAGENMLTVAPAPRPERDRDDDDPDEPHYIPFWVAR